MEISAMGIHFIQAFTMVFTTRITTHIFIMAMAIMLPSIEEEEIQSIAQEERLLDPIDPISVLVEVPTPDPKVQDVQTTILLEDTVIMSIAKMAIR